MGSDISVIIITNRAGRFFSLSLFYNKFIKIYLHLPGMPPTLEPFIKDGKKGYEDNEENAYYKGL